MQDWLWACAADLGLGISARKIDPVDLCVVYLASLALLTGMPLGGKLRNIGPTSEDRLLRIGYAADRALA